MIKALAALMEDKCEKELSTDYNVLEGGVDFKEVDNGSHGFYADAGTRMEPQKINPDTQAAEPEISFTSSGCSSLAASMDTSIQENNRSSCFVEVVAVRQDITANSISEVKVGNINTSGCCNVNIINEANTDVNVTQQVNISSSLDMSDIMSASALSAMDSLQTSTLTDSATGKVEANSSAAQGMVALAQNGAAPGNPPESARETTLKTRTKQLVPPDGKKVFMEQFKSTMNTANTLALTDKSAKQVIKANSTARVTVGNIDLECYLAKTEKVTKDEKNGTITTETVTLCLQEDEQMDRQVLEPDDQNSDEMQFRKMYYKGKQMEEKKDAEGRRFLADTDGSRVAIQGYWFDLAESQKIAALLNTVETEKKTRIEAALPYSVSNFKSTMKMREKYMAKLLEKENFKKNMLTGESSSSSLNEGITDYVFLKDQTIEKNFLVDQSTSSSPFFWDATFKVFDFEKIQTSSGEAVPKPFKVFTRIRTGEPDVQFVKITSSTGKVTYAAEPFGGLNVGGDKNKSCMRRKVLSDLPKIDRNVYATSFSINNKSSVRVAAVQQFGSVMNSVIKSNQESDTSGSFYSDQREVREFTSDLEDVSLPIDYGNAKIATYNTAAASSISGSFFVFFFLALFIIWGVRRRIRRGPNDTGWIKNNPEGEIYTAKDFSWWKPWDWDKKISAKFVDSNPVKFSAKEGGNFIIIPPQDSGGKRYWAMDSNGVKLDKDIRINLIEEMNAQLGWSQQTLNGNSEADTSPPPAYNETSDSTSEVTSSQPAQAPEKKKRCFQNNGRQRRGRICRF